MNTDSDGHGWLPLPVIIALGWIVITSLAFAIAELVR